jgi:predicted acyltransferase
MLILSPEVCLYSNLLAKLMNSDLLTASPKRLLSLDVFRGITVAAMILVNNPGDWTHIYPPLKHAAWNGCTPTDLIFPFFLFIVGVSIVYALAAKKLLKTAHPAVMRSVLKRSLILFGLGLLLSLFPRFDFSTVRIMGVLQRIALVFFCCSLIYLKTTFRTQVWLLAALLISYWLLMTLVPVPGVGYPNLEPATNLGAWLDRAILTEPHLWKTSKVWDPEGLLGTIPAIGTGLIGMLTGTWLRKTSEPGNKIAWLLVLGNAAILAGLIWDGWFPVNKALWTSSYVLFTGGLAMNGLAMCYWLIDAQGYQRWTKPFVVFGVNAITVFFLSGLIPRIMSLIKVDLNGEEVDLKTWLYETFFTPYLSPLNASLAGAITFVLIWLGILWMMYHKQIIIKV